MTRVRHDRPIDAMTSNTGMTAVAAGVVFVCFFLSGATGLVYQVVWLRMLSLTFGHTVYAITTVLAAFMAGLALGSLLFARVAGRVRRPIMAYGLLEIGIGISCALTPLLFSVAAAMSRSSGGFAFVQFALAVTVLLVPTALMGATLPLLSDAVARDPERTGRSVGMLYASNTFGAVVGVATAGYVLLPALGNLRTVLLAVAANLVIGIVAVALSWRHALDGGPRAAGPDSAAAPPDRDDRSARPAVASSRTLMAAALAVSGAVSMTYEVAWTRALTLVIGSSTYAFTSMLLAFLVGIAAGSALYSWTRGARRVGVEDFAAVQAGIAIAVVAPLLLFEWMPLVFLGALKWSQSPPFVQTLQFVVSAAALLPSTLLIGATFPCAVSIVGRGAPRVGRMVGRLYAANTVGAIAGTVVVGFVLIPAVGVQTSLRIGAAGTVLLAGALLAARASRWWRWGGLGGAVLAAIAILLALPRWDPHVMASGPAVHGAEIVDWLSRGERFRDAVRRDEVIYYRDGLSGTVSVHKSLDNIYLRVNGKTDASLADDPTQLLLGHLPMVLHPDARSVLIIGFGSGMTAGAVAAWPVSHVDVVELEAAVLDASRFFVRENRDVLSDPRVHVTVTDGRNFLLRSDRQYDIIISEPSNPWIGGLASLFTTEFFRAARGHLRPGGLMVQWVQGYRLHADDLRMVAHTFRSAFPATMTWSARPEDFLLIGQTRQAAIDLGRLRSAFETNAFFRADLERIRVRHWAELLAYFMLDDGATARFSASGRINDDDRLPLEFSAPRALYLQTTASNRKLLLSHASAALPLVTPDTADALQSAAVRVTIGRAFLRRRLWDRAYAQFAEALRLDPSYTPAGAGAGLAALGLGRPDEALTHAQRVLAARPGDTEASRVAVAASRVLARLANRAGVLEQLLR